MLFRNNKDKIYFLFFGGTWCEDTHFILPKFYKVQEASGFPESRITVFAVDRKKNVLRKLGTCNEYNQDTYYCCYERW